MREGREEKEEGRTVKGRSLSSRSLVAGATGFVLNLLLGVVYAWSVFVEPLEAQFGWVRTETSLVFTVSMGCLCAGHLASGVLLPRTSPRCVLFLAAVLSCTGFLASAAGNSLGWFAVSYGICCGLAVGLGANCVLSTVLLWFPDCRGLASGVLLAGVGLGSLAFGVPVAAVIEALGWREAFVCLGIAFALALGAGALLLKAPSARSGRLRGTGAFGSREIEGPIPESAAGASASCWGMTTAQMLRTGSFWGFFCWIVLMGTGGLALISNAVPAAAAVVQRSGGGAGALAFATAAMGLIGVANSAGRLASGWIWDRFGFRVALAAAPMELMAAMALCIAADELASPASIIGGFMLLGASYGGSVSPGSALTGSFFGMEHYPMNYAVVSLNILVASLVGPAVTATSWDLSGSYLAAYVVLALLALAALVVGLLLRPPRD